jgi:hypothetical protein
MTVPRRRKLSLEETRRIEAWAMAKAQAEHPNGRVTIIVSALTDQSGCANYTTLVSTTATIPFDELPRIEPRSEAGSISPQPHALKVT